MYRLVARLARLAFLFALFLSAAPAAHAGPASDVIAKLNTVFIDVMQNGQSLGYEGRYKKLEPALSDAYDFPEMTRVSLGRHWRELTDEQKQQVTAAFKDLSLATYAARFNNFSGQRFEILGEEPAPGGSVRVNNQIVPSDGTPIRIDYLVKQKDGQWRVTDVYLKSSVSELAVRRADFTDTLAKSGVNGLLADLKAKVDKLRSGEASTSTSN